MATLLYSATMSLDGYIAGPRGDMHWLTPYVGPNAIADDLVGDVGALLVGARTFGGDDPNKDTDAEGAFGGTWHGQVVVLSHHAPSAPAADTTFCDDLVTAVATAKSAAGDRYVNVLGADVARQCLEANLLDEVYVIVAPVLLGGGTRLFTGAGPVRLERTHHSAVPLGTNLWFRVLR